MSAVEDRLAEIEARDLLLCGTCDGGLPMACTCGDPRASLSLTVAALRAVLALHLEWVAGGLCRHGVDSEGCARHYPCPTVRAIAAALDPGEPR